jgi:hypothetical protein
LRVRRLSGTQARVLASDASSTLKPITADSGMMFFTATVIRAFAAAGDTWRSRPRGRARAWLLTIHPPTKGAPS